MSDTWQQPTFEGMTVDIDKGVVAAFEIILPGPLHMYEQVEFAGRGVVAEVSHAADKDKTGFLDTGRRKVKIVPIEVHLVPGDE